MQEAILLEHVDGEKGKYRWYRVSLEGESGNTLFAIYNVVIERGRIGEAGEVITKSFTEREAASKFFRARVKEKLGRGYVRVDGVSSLTDPACVLCRLIENITEEPRVIHEFQKSVLILNRDQTYLGRSMLVFKKHIPDFFRLAPSELLGSLSEIRLSEEALRKAFAPALVNYLFMGNRAGHVHLHLVPRYKTDPHFGNSPFLDTKKTLRAQMSDGQYREIVEKIQEQLKSPYGSSVASMR